MQSIHTDVCSVAASHAIFISCIFDLVAFVRRLLKVLLTYLRTYLLTYLLNLLFQYCHLVNASASYLVFADIVNLTDVCTIINNNIIIFISVVRILCCIFCHKKSDV